MCFSIQINRDLKKVAAHFGADISLKHFQNFHSLQTNDPKTYKAPDSENRIFPNYYAPIVHMVKGKKILRPMRYRVRPNGSKEEVPAKYNVFNARLDALEKRKTWQSIFMKNHCLLPFTQFYEWVSHEGKKKLITFNSDQHEIMWAPALFDTWKSHRTNQEITSFAVITTGPPKEIEEMGHDRCPIFLKEEHINDWLNPTSKDAAYDILGQQEQVTYQHNWVS
jgi:putative SOS response-associated peptidase YedK